MSAKVPPFRGCIPGHRAVSLKAWLHHKWQWPAEGLRNPHGGGWTKRKKELRIEHS